MNQHGVQAASYGIGAIYPIVVLDRVHRWHRPVHPGLPEQQPDDRHGMLVLRWTGPPSEEAEAPTLLEAAAARAPAAPPDRAELQAFHASLPPGLHLIDLPARHVIGPWSQRPGATRPHVPRRAA
ncbi:hypothetical protein OG883_44505 [Streptomyces sp. NBC_01142]|uniref:hypothetical protein n=1 Tax=Streptomyces sp. NBC_01142 TaxID=2975865 RepID=UPI0022559BE0|nr:hypothetical protein [Streptomyces sp. NBC_01142]MCX4826707.1 hypothetical protein [Streptomyces sp. NBC_01142]